MKLIGWQNLTNNDQPCGIILLARHRDAKGTEEPEQCKCGVVVFLRKFTMKKTHNRGFVQKYK